MRGGDVDFIISDLFRFWDLVNIIFPDDILEGSSSCWKFEWIGLDDDDAVRGLEFFSFEGF